MSVFDSLLLGTVQGLTEFLPVSSSGHLILMREILGLNTQGGLAFDAVLQLGTIFAVLVYFRHDVLNLVRATALIVIGRGESVARAERNLVFGLVVGTIPALVLGLLLERTMETTFRSPLLVAVMLLAGSAFFVLAERFSKKTKLETTIADGWWVGVFQTLALVPGVSRSGATISGGLFLGLTREVAARFSFLLSIPIITGSGLKKLLDVIQERPADIDVLSLGIGFLAAFLIGFACIHFLLEYLKRHNLNAFVWYRTILAVIVLLVVLWR
jgi:undecaprenyl-diphosphatase